MTDIKPVIKMSYNTFLPDCVPELKEGKVEIELKPKLETLTAIQFQLLALSFEKRKMSFEKASEQLLDRLIEKLDPQYLILRSKAVYSTGTQEIEYRHNKYDG